MSLADLIADVARLGVQLEADGDRLRFHPRAALTPELLTRLKVHKAELLTWLRPSVETAPAKVVCGCGSTTWRDVPIHGGQSVRRDCRRCNKFIEFPVWYGDAIDD